MDVEHLVLTSGSRVGGEGLLVALRGGGLMAVRADAECVEGAVYPAPGGVPVDLQAERVGRVVRLTGHWDGDGLTGVAVLEEREPASRRALRRSPPGPARDWDRRKAGQPCAVLAGVVGFALTPNGGHLVRRAGSPRDPWLIRDVAAAVRAWERRRRDAGDTGQSEEDALVGVSVAYVTPGLAEALLPAPDHLVTFWTLLRPDLPSSTN